MSWGSSRSGECERRFFGRLSRAPSFKFGTYDLETYGINDDRLQMIGCFDGRSYANFTRLEDFLAHVLRPKYHGFRWFAHFGGRFDVHYLFDYIRAVHPDWDLSFYCSGSCVVSLTVRLGGHRWKFCDSYRLLPAPLAELTREFQVSHQKLAFDPSSVEYNRNDCIGLYETLEIFFRECGAMAETIASLALRVYRAQFLDREIFAPSEKVEAFIRRGYFGGRCELYRFDERKVTKYDVNSLYPRAMIEPVPVEYQGYSKRLPDDDREIGFYDAEIKYPECYLPALPAVFSGRLFFPVGRFRGVFSSMELRAAIEAGAGVSIIGGVKFRSSAIFTEFVDAFYQMKQEAEKSGNSGRRYAAKLLMNSLYGKFGQRREQVVYFLDPGRTLVDPERPDDAYNRIWPLPGGLAYHFRLSRACHIMPHISACVTSRARLITLDYLRRAGRVWYTDTDSIFTDTVLPTGDSLGSLKSEGRGMFRGYGLKEYEFAGRVAVKGVSVTVTDPLTGQKTYNAATAEKYLRGEPIEVERRAGFLESIRAGEPTVRRIQSTKLRHQRLEKRARCGVDTRPWEARELLGLV